MNKDQMLAEREDLVPACLLQERDVIVKKEPKTLTQGPCNRLDGEKCSTFISPKMKWKNGDCNMASHLIHQDDVQKFVNPIKASKRGE